jgi:hypothetical protein|nr:MAG TPA: hypothetical protein [Caudoviricetes sp.]
MNDIIITVDTSTGYASCDNSVIGIRCQNLQNKLIFVMTKKIKGIAWVEIKQGEKKTYTILNETETGYETNILSGLLTDSTLEVNLRITETENPNGIPVFVSTIVSFIVLDSINASEQMPEEYPSWLDVANAKIQEIENVNIESERIDTGVLIKTTDNQGQTTTVELKDGKDGEKGDKGDQGEPGAVKMQIVDVLPTTGRSDTIYLVKKEHPTERNLYEEYIYTNGDWEHIGDTSVDLTDYYNKNQVDEKLDGKQNILTAGDNIKLENDIISSEVPVYIVQYNKLDEAGLILKKVFELYKAGTEFQLILKDGISIYQLTKIYDSSSAGTVSFYFADPELSGALTKYGINYLTVEYFNLFLYLNDNSVRRSRHFSYTFQRGDSTIWPLGAKNTEEYIPIGDYNPSTKKYVDDSIKSAITDTLGGSY